MLPSRLPGIAEQLQELPELPVRLQDLTISSSFSWTWWKSQCSQTSFAICQVPSAWGPGQQIQPRVGYFKKIRDTSWKLYWGNVISMRNWGGTPLSIIMANSVLFWGLSKRLNEAQLCKKACFPQPNFWKNPSLVSFAIPSLLLISPLSCCRAQSISSRVLALLCFAPPCDTEALKWEMVCAHSRPPGQTQVLDNGQCLSPSLRSLHLFHIRL